MVLCYKVILNSSNMTICALTLQNLNTVQYIRWNIKREGLCEIYNVRPLAILREEGSHSNAPLNENPTKCSPIMLPHVDSPLNKNPTPCQNDGLCNMSGRSHASLQSSHKLSIQMLLNTYSLSLDSIWSQIEI